MRPPLNHREMTMGLLLMSVRLPDAEAPLHCSFRTALALVGLKPSSPKAALALELEETTCLHRADLRRLRLLAEDILAVVSPWDWRALTPDTESAAKLSEMVAPLLRDNHMPMPTVAAAIGIPPTEFAMALAGYGALPIAAYRELEMLEAQALESSRRGAEAQS